MRRIKGAARSIDEIGKVKVDGSGLGEIDIILSFRGSAVGLWVQLLRRTFMKRRMQPGVPK